VHTANVRTTEHIEEGAGVTVKVGHILTLRDTEGKFRVLEVDWRKKTITVAPAIRVHTDERFVRPFADIYELKVLK
jgi:hypothetical protein